MRFPCPTSTVGVLVNEAEEHARPRGAADGQGRARTSRSGSSPARTWGRASSASGPTDAVSGGARDVYPWLDRHPELRRFLRTQFRRIEADEETCASMRSAPSEETGDGWARTACPSLRPRWWGWWPAGSSRTSSSGTASYAATWIAEMLARNGVDPRDLGSGAGLRLRMRPRDPSLAPLTARAAVRLATTTHSSCSGARRTCRSATFA